MLKRFLMLATAAMLLSFSFVNASAQASARSGSDDVPRYEIGGQLFGQNGHDIGLGWGAGGRFTYNINEYVALDNEVDFFLPDEGPPYATQGLFGVKVGKRIRDVGVFVKARPGFQTNLLVNGREQTRFAFDVGAVAEAYPNRHLVLRFDASDVIIPFNNNLVGVGSRAQRVGTTHNLLISFGIGVRF
ncbi:MAG TPA: hypothetical protein VK619_00595 [Pyrinomonadaceae bacterium]|nr:hypothetical protein [Pyrinomonadaceae bacterium]